MRCQPSLYTDVFVVSGRQIRGYAMNYRYTIFPFPALGWSPSAPDEMVATGGRINGQWQSLTSRGSTNCKSIRNKAFDVEHLFLFMSAAEAVRAWRNDNVTYRQGSFDILLVPVTSSLTGFFKNLQVSLNRGTETLEDNRAGVIMAYKIHADYAYWRFGDFLCSACRPSLGFC